MSETAERAPEEEVAALPPTPGLGGGFWGAVKRVGAVLAQQREATVFVVAVLLVIYFWRTAPSFAVRAMARLMPSSWASHALSCFSMLN